MKKRCSDCHKMREIEEVTGICWQCYDERCKQNRTPTSKTDEAIWKSIAPTLFLPIEQKRK
jgi:hypothetical protein